VKQSPVCQAERLVDYRPRQVRFRWNSDAGAYRHNFERDLHGIAIWDAARDAADTVLEEVARGDNSLEVLQAYDISWSSRHIASNFNRIYGRDPSNPSSRHEKVGAGPFLYIVVEDHEPDYIVWQNISGKVEFTNRSIAHLKPRIRAITETETFRYNIHSSNSLVEFMSDAVLFLGLDIFREQLADGFPERGPAVSLEQDMAGAGGWNDLSEMFEVMRYACNAVVLRGYEELRGAGSAANFSVDEIDILCDDLGSLSGAACATPTSSDPSKSAFTTLICGRTVKLDVRSVGDGYQDARWQQQMLGTATWDEGGFPALEPVNYLFSLLCHAKVQKPTVKPLYQQVLPDLARQVGLPPDVAQQVTSDEVAARLLSGYLVANNYRIPVTTDRRVHRNRDFAARLGSLVDAGRVARPKKLIAHLRREVRRRAASIPWVRNAYRRLRSLGR